MHHLTYGVIRILSHVDVNALPLHYPNGAASVHAGHEPLQVRKVVSLTLTLTRKILARGIILIAQVISSFFSSFSKL